ncbi:MAG TPA: hypothetical protein DEF05_08655 [Erwinia sp.]|uniref:hypothetical protein n=1 Tax=Erwinia citreus TaxID=558 RepID=UPI000E91071D|nr:hypothetical protein [Erwinia sp.]HBV39734.1 hypothetical protein [Erwinia sp.]
MNPLQSGIPSRYTRSISSAQSVAAPGAEHTQLKHPQTLSLASLSTNAHWALNQSEMQPNGHHQLLALLASNAITDGALQLCSTRGAEAHYEQQVDVLPENDVAHLTVRAQLNECAKYDIGKYDIAGIDLHVPSSGRTESIFLSAPPPPTNTPTPPVSSSYQAQCSRSDLMQRSIEQHHPQEAANAPGSHLIKAAQSRMQYGTLSLFGTETGERYGNLMYKASYKPHSPMNIENSSYADFLPGQPDLVGEHLEFYKDEFMRGLSERQDPIIAAPTEQGSLVVVEGHHRLTAALATGMPVKLLINADKESADYRDWSNISFINKGDDGYETDVPSYKQRGM